MGPNFNEFSCYGYSSSGGIGGYNYFLMGGAFYGVRSLFSILLDIFFRPSFEKSSIWLFSVQIAYFYIDYSAFLSNQTYTMMAASGVIRFLAFSLVLLLRLFLTPLLYLLSTYITLHAKTVIVKIF